MKKSLIFLLVFSLTFIPSAAAHPYTEETIPSLTSNSPKGVSEVIVYFSESVEIDFSQLKVLDSEGNQIDNKDTDYYEGEESLIVTTPPLEDGIYTVSTKVLSKVDGHLVPDVFLFTVGDVVVPPEILLESKELVFLPEAGSRFPGLAGQTIVLGAVIASVMIWGTQNKKFNQRRIREDRIYPSWKVHVNNRNRISINFCIKYFDDCDTKYKIRNLTYRCNSNKFWKYLDNQNDHYNNFARNLVWAR